MARFHVLIQVDGPPGAGKTTLIERFLESNRTRLMLAARLREGRPGKGGSDPEENGETRRYREAGAFDAAVYRYRGEQVGDAARRLVQGPFSWEEIDGVVMESPGDHVDPAPDLVVYVTRPLPEGQNLVSRGPQVLARINLADFVTILNSQNPPLSDAEGGPAGEEVEVGEEIEIPDDWAERGVPLTRGMWRLPESHAELGRARVVVINVRSDGERAAGERLAEEIRRIGRDPKIIRDIDPRGAGGHRRVSVFMANLGERRDPELGPALARIKRTFRWR